MKTRFHFTYLLYSLLFLPAITKAQQKINDSLLAVANETKSDTTKATAYNIIASNYEGENKYSVADSFARLAIKYSSTANYIKGLAEAYHTIGFIYEDKGDYPKELDALNRSLQLYIETGDKNKIARLTANVGNAYNYQGSYAQAIKLYVEALDMFTKTGDKSGMALLYGNIANIYTMLKEYKNALDYFSRAIDAYADLGNKAGVARNMANLAHTYAFMGDYDKAKHFLLQAMDVEKAMGRKRGIEMNLESIGDINFQAKDYDSAFVYYSNALMLAKELEDKRAIAGDMEGIGTIYMMRKNYKEAETFLLQALGIDTIIHRYEGIKSISTNLRDLYVTTGQWQKAFTYYRLFETANDSLVNADKSKEIGRIEAKADYDTQLTLKQADNDKRTALAAAESKRQKLTIFFVAVFALAVACIAVIILRSLRITRKQKALIENQKQVVEQQKILVEQQKAIVDEKNKDITDSIHYASRIQRALLTTDEYISKRLSDYFILFKPRDIVSGDFYWAFEAASLNPSEGGTGKGDGIPLSGGHRGAFYIAACDCTGHGVPGAFMSLLNISILNEVVVEKKIYEPAKILGEVRDHIIKALNPKGKDDGSKDGMDCILASLAPSSPKGGMTLTYTAAYNTPLVIKKSPPSEGGEAVVLDLPTDKMPVGIFTGEKKPFTQHSVELQKGDCIYLFTDGYADQFGGPKGKKFKYKALSEKLKAISEKPMAEQKQLLEQTFEEWKGNLEQVDDVLIIGIRV
jgi:serine phosphatase RsbU (regulator of sigma subunit)